MRYARAPVTDGEDDSFEDWARKKAAASLGGTAEASESWRSSDARWSQCLADELRAGRLARATRFAEFVAEELARRGALSETGSVTPFDDPDDYAQTNRMPVAREDDTETHTAIPSFRQVMKIDVVQPPEPNQTHTAIGGVPSRSVDELRAITAAMDWSVEQYARYRADLLHGSNAQEVLERHDLHLGKAKQRVEEAWSRRLNEDPDLLRRYEAAFESLE